MLRPNKSWLMCKGSGKRRTIAERLVRLRDGFELLRARALLVFAAGNVPAHTGHHSDDCSTPIVLVLVCASDR